MTFDFEIGYDFKFEQFKETVEDVRRRTVITHIQRAELRPAIFFGDHLQNLYP
jgi:hypothetical protein